MSNGSSSAATCLVCGDRGSTFFLLAPLDKYARAMGRREGPSYYFCARCHVAFQHPVLSDEEYRLFYEQVQRSDRVGYAGGGVPKAHLKRKQDDVRFKWRLLSLLDLDALVPGRKVFEIGPGEGMLLASFKRRGYQASGVEPFDRYARYARETFGLDVKTGYFGPDTVPAEAPDLVILDNVLEHLKAPFEALRQVRGIVQRGALLYVAVPDLESATVGEANIGHVTLWSRQALIFAVECAGFHILSVMRGRPAHAPHEWVSLSMAAGAAEDASARQPLPVPGSDLRLLRPKWDKAVQVYESGLARRKRFGAAYPVLRAFRRLIRAATGR